LQKAPSTANVGGVTLRSILLTALPKVALSRLTGLLAATPLPTSLRGPVYRAFARRYGADLTEMAGAPAYYRSLAAFFQRPLRAGARPAAAAPLLWPCDGRIVTSGPIAGERVPQVKGRDYALADLLGDRSLASLLAGGSQATIYLAPGDYHRVHAPFAAQLTAVVPLRGTLFPVNPPAVQCIGNLFPRNSRRVFHCRLGDGRTAAVVMVGAFNVGHITVSAAIGGSLRPGDELGRFGFGSTVVLLLPPGAEAVAALPPETRVRMGQALPLQPR
jgi:phosphatidylserine decarboxylase